MKHLQSFKDVENYRVHYSESSSYIKNLISELMQGKACKYNKFSIEARNNYG